MAADAIERNPELADVADITLLRLVAQKRLKEKNPRVDITMRILQRLAGCGKIDMHSDY